MGMAETPGPAAVGRLALRFGVGAGVACAVWLLLLHASGNNAFGPKQLLGQLLVPLAAAASQWLLRRNLAPAEPGVGRALAVGGLTVLLAAALAGSSVWGLAHGVSQQALDRNRAEMVEIVHAQQQIRPKAKRSVQLEAQELRQAAALTSGDLALGAFTRVLLLGMLVALPGGLYLRK